ncbi:MAG: hypothetical protein PV340_04205 [Wolbachia sp.]|nr:hypothetical protein [Wolbachia sp.]MDD9336197.1 hypothetical protein [Wolbachia sp.]
MAENRNGEFGLVKYIAAYLKISGRGKCKGENEEFNGKLEDFIIATDINFDLASLANRERISKYTG